MPLSVEHFKWSHWTAEFSPAPPFDREAFQAQVDAICGTYRGQSIVTLVYGGENEEEKAVYISDLGVQNMEKVGVNMTRVRGVPQKVRIHRWIFMVLQPAEQLPEPGMVTMPNNRLILPKELVEAKRRGHYEKLYGIADHSQCPSDICNSFEYFCWGDYREPDQRDLDKLARIRHKILQSDVQVDPTRPISEDTVAKLHQQAADQIAAEERRSELVM